MKKNLKLLCKNQVHPRLTIGVVPNLDPKFCGHQPDPSLFGKTRATDDSKSKMVYPPVNWPSSTASCKYLARKCQKSDSKLHLAVQCGELWVGAPLQLLRHSRYCQVELPRQCCQTLPNVSPLVVARLVYMQLPWLQPKWNVYANHPEAVLIVCDVPSKLPKSYRFPPEKKSDHQLHTDLRRRSLQKPKLQQDCWFALDLDAMRLWQRPATILC